MVRWSPRIGASIAILLLVSLVGTSTEDVQSETTADPLSDPTHRALRSAETCQHGTDTSESILSLPSDPTLAAGEGQQPLFPPYEPCQGAIRPGARMSAPVGCTYNFIFSQGNTFYIGTAAHCVSGAGQRVSAQGVGSFGTVVFSGWDHGPSSLANDFALIQIDADRHDRVDPTMCTFGGPTAVGSQPGLIDQEFLLQYAWGVATLSTAQTRSRIHDEMQSTSTTLRWNGVGSGGDSGGPLLYGDGTAAGIHTAGLTPVAGVVWEQGPTIQRILQLTSQNGYNLQLETAAAKWTMPV